jgi:ABC-type nitrate/sulfonate/bicarbonate transport system permease component
MMVEGFTRRVLNVVGVLLFLLAWEIAGRWLGANKLAPPSLVVPAFVDLLRQGEMLRELAGSVRQMLLGFGLACAVGMPLGVAMGRIRWVDLAATPWVSMFVVTSVASLVPLFILLFGTGFAFRAAVVFIASVWYIVLTTYNGARTVDPGLIAVARSFGASPAQTAWKVILPALYPYLFAGARIGLIHAIRAMVLAEMFVILGFGGLVHQTGLQADTAPLISLLIALMILSVGATWLLRVVGEFVSPGYEQRLRGA